MKRSAHLRFQAYALSLLLPILVIGCGGGGGGGSPTPPADLGFRVLAVSPVDGAVSVPITTEVVVTFSETLYAGTITDRNFLVTERASGTAIEGTVDMIGANRSAVFKFTADLLRNTRYKVRILPDVTSFKLDTLPEEFVSYFTTAVSDAPPPPPPPPTPDATLRAIGSMTVGRSSHRATLLGNGDVLITGGFAISSAVTSVAEIFDTSEEEFVRLGTTMTLARGFHTATRLNDGTVLLLGGSAGPTLEETDTAEIYDPSTAAFTRLTAEMVKPRAFHTATLLGDGRVFIAGGAVPQASGSFSSKTAEIYDPSTKLFTALPEMAAFRAGHTATLLPDGTVLLAGGNSTDVTTETFDPTTDTFSTNEAFLKAVRRGHTATLLDDETVLLAGGGDRTAEIFVIDKDYFRWASGFPLYDRKDHTATFTQSGRVLISGGSYTVGTSLVFQDSMELYSPETGAFLGTTLRLSSPRTRHRATMLADGRILITGGANLDPTFLELNTAAIYEEASD